MENNLKVFETYAFHKHNNKKCLLLCLANTRGEAKVKFMNFKLPRGYKLRTGYHLILTSN